MIELNHYKGSSIEKGFKPLSEINSFEEIKDILDSKLEKGYISQNLYDSALEELETLQKSGEGSKGGQVIGHTKSGKPIYGPRINYHSHHVDFSKDDHKDAKEHHLKMSDKLHKEAQEAEDKGDDKLAQKKSSESAQHSSLMDYHRTEMFKK